MKFRENLIIFAKSESEKIGFRFNPTSQTAFPIHIYKNFNQENLTYNFCLLN
jgi:hypothetical protein